MTNSRKQSLRTVSAILFTLLQLLRYIVSLLGSKSYNAFFGLVSFLHEVSIPITLLAQHSHALNVLAAEVVHDY